jgi:hypothetical protein
MSYSVYLCQPFKRSVKLLLKHFPHVKDDVALALREIVQSPSVGVVIPGSNGVRKARVKNSDLQRGKICQIRPPRCDSWGTAPVVARTDE